MTKLADEVLTLINENTDTPQLNEVDKTHAFIEKLWNEMMLKGKGGINYNTISSRATYIEITFDYGLFKGDVVDKTEKFFDAVVKKFASKYKVDMRGKFYNEYVLFLKNKGID